MERIRTERLTVAGVSLPVRRHAVLIVGSGAAGLNAAVHLAQMGVQDVLVVTESTHLGTSRNAGSDKQTYYKLSVAGNVGDSVLEMAKDLSRSGAMQGDIALIEASCSVREFFHLIELGVEFPHDEFGRYGGYKTDNDPLQRASSIGPWTSRSMVVRLLAAARQAGVVVEEGKVVGRLLTIPSDKGSSCVGAILCPQNATSVSQGMEVVMAEDVLWASGGPGDLFSASVYPEGQWSALGLALLSGATAQNMTEWQFGIASTKPRWNLSGSYQQVLPSYVSTTQDGKDPQSFLQGRWGSVQEETNALFRKGYEWPFDATRVISQGSSLVDLWLLEEVSRGRRVWLDYQTDPLMRDGSFRPDLLSEEARTYLMSCEALLPCPLERLRRMNGPAVSRFMEAGVDLSKERIEIGVCAQHLNGGLRGDLWWETDVQHLFALGEANGTHGVKRPGGSALNSGQVAGLRAAQKIVSRRKESEKDLQVVWVEVQVAGFLESIKLGQAGSASLSWVDVGDHTRDIVTRAAGPVRDPDVVEAGVRFMARRWDQIRKGDLDYGDKPLLNRLKLEGQILTSWSVLESMRAYVEAGGGSRGGYVVQAGQLTDGPQWVAEAPELRNKILTVQWQGDAFTCDWDPVRPVPEQEPWFETMWQKFRAGRVWDV